MKKRRDDKGTSQLSLTFSLKEQNAKGTAKESSLPTQDKKIVRLHDSRQQAARGVLIKQLKKSGLID